MPIDPNAALASLRRQVPGSALSVPGDNMSTELQHYALLKQLQDEADDRANAYQRAGDPAAAAFNALSKQYGGDIAKSSVEQARPAYDEFVDAQNKARLAGFGTDLSQPAAQAAAYGRATEQAKINAPREAAVAAAREKAAGDLAVAQVNQKPYEAFMGLIGGNGLQAGDTASIAGLGSIHRGTAPREVISPVLMSQLAKAREEAETAKSGLFSGLTGAGAAKQAKVDQLIADIFNQHPASNGIKDLAHQIISNQKTAGLPFSQILSRVGGDAMDANEADQLRDLLNILRGRDF